MFRRRGRAYLWKLLLPFPVAVALVVAAGLQARRAWQPPSAPRPRTSRHLQETQPHPVDQAPHPTLPAPAAPSPQAEAVPAPQAAAEPAPRPQVRAPGAPSAPEVKPAVAAPASPPTSSPAVARAVTPVQPPQRPLVPAPEPQTAPRAAPPAPAQPLQTAWAGEGIRSVRFDAGYYYGRGRSAQELAEELTRSWSEKGVNLVYFYAYNRVYGARYRTRYAGNVMEDYGRQDLLGHLLRAAHGRDIKVVAWLYGLQHKQMWEAHPSWRQKTADGRDYRPDADSYYLCVRDPEVVRWWMGFMDDLLTSYPDLDGVDMAECQIDTWGDHACHCEDCREQFAQAHPGEAAGTPTWRRFRAEGLTRILIATNRLAHSYGKEAHITTVFTARPDGSLMTANQVRDAIGFDLQALLASAEGPEVIQAELIWQQWAALYRNQSTFTPEWTCQAVREAKKMVGRRARLICHVEVTDFGAGGLDGPKIGKTVAAAVRGEPYGVDIYDAHLLEKTEGAGRYLQLAWLGPAE